MAKVFTEADFMPESGTGRRFTDADFEGGDLPNYANGLSPKTPINSSPISVADRAKLAVGNEAGKVKFLKENYGEVQRAKNGDLLVQDKSDGLWKRVDADGLGSGNAWEQTKEALADMADALPTSIKIGAQVGTQLAMTAGTVAAGVASGGASVAPSLAAQAAASGAVGAGLEGISTSLGRLAGTYDATPEEQMQDIGTELLLNAGGVYIGAGIMKGARELPKLLSAATKNMGGLTEPGKGALATLRRVLNGVPEEQTRILLEQGNEVAEAMTRAQGAARGVEAQQQFLKENSILATKTVVDSIKQTKNAVYKSIKSDLLEAAAKDPELATNFKPDVTGALNVLNVLSHNGLGKFTKEVTTDVATGAVTSPGGVRFAVNSAKEMEEHFLKTGVLKNAIGLDKEKGLALLHKVAKDFQNIANADYAKGVGGMKQMLDVDTMVRDLTDELFNAAEKYNSPALTGLAQQIKDVAVPAISSNFNFKNPVLLKSIQRMPAELQSKLGVSAVATNPLEMANQFYYKTSQMFRPIESAVAGGAGLETLLNQVTSAGTRNTSKKSAVETMAEVAKYTMPGVAKGFEKALNAIRVNGTAATHLNWARPGLTSAMTGQAATGALVGGNPLVAGSIAASGAAASPRLSYHVIRAGQKALDMMRTMTPAARKLASSSPEFIQGVVGTILDAPAAQNQIASQLMQQGYQAVKGR